MVRSQLTRTLLTRTTEQLDAILHSGSGSLLETPYPILLLALARREKSALLSLHRNPLQKEIVFDNGSPVDCHSNIATETFARFLVSSGKLSESNCHAALVLAASRAVPLEDVLAEQKLLSPTELSRMGQQSLGRKLLEPFSWKNGTFEISFEVPPADSSLRGVDSSLRVRVPQLVLTGILKIETQDNVDEAVAFAADQYLSLAPEPLFEIDDIRLSKEQQRVIDAVRGGTRLSDVAAHSGIESDDVNRIVYALLLLGAITVSESPVRAVPFFELDHPFLSNTSEAAPPPLQSRSATPPSSHSPSTTPKPKEEVAPATAEEVIAAHRSHKTKDAFDLLEVADTDGPSRFIRAFLGIADRFLPSRFDEGAPDGLRDKAQDVFLAAARAYAELADPQRREALLLHRSLSRNPPEVQAVADRTSPAPAPTAAAPPAPMPERRPPPKAKRILIDPEELCDAGRALAEAGKLREALSSFEMAAECDAQNGTYAAEVAWCRFSLRVSPAPSTLRMLKNAIRIDPGSGLAHLYAGKVAATIGSRTEASAFLNRAAMLMPRDMRVVEALKSLR